MFIQPFSKFFLNEASLSSVFSFFNALYTSWIFEVNPTDLGNGSLTSAPTLQDCILKMHDAWLKGAWEKR